MKWLRVLAVLGCVALAATVSAQSPTGSLSGQVIDESDAPLPGVTVTAASDAMQGKRVAVTSGNGDYMFTSLPPGSYAVKFELQGFQTIDTTVKISAGMASKIDAKMPTSTVEEQITVTGAYETISTSITGAATFEQDTIELLPVPRNLYNAVAIAPGVHTTGPSGNISISGAMSYENLFLINGVVVNENIRGQATDAYIEDAIQETTTSTSGVSAEFGRFAGGVVNMLTKSGGNEFHGSLRTNFDKDVWTAPTPKTTAQRADDLNKTYEATLGGKFIRDRLWFFVAGRDRENTATSQTVVTNIGFGTSLEETRYEGKLTASPTPNHRLIASYQERERAWGNYTSNAALVDLTLIYPRSIPEQLFSANYTGVLAENLFIEGQYSQRKLTFKDSGSRFTDRIAGTPIIDRSTGRQGNSPTFCGVCGDETRDNEDYIVKGTYFLSTEKLGSHDLVAGVDVFSDMVYSNNHQSGSDWDIRPATFKYEGENWYPVIQGGAGATSVQMVWWPIPELSQGSDFTTQSAFINDRWRLSKNLSFNIGVRYDKNDGKNALKKTISDDSRFSPRLGVAWDVKSDGDLVINANWGRYVTALANTGNVGGTSPGGNPSTLVWFYRGPSINTGSAPYVSPTDALAQIWDWFDNENCDAEGHCGTANISGLVQATFRGYNRIVQGSLASPYAEELAIGATKRLGTRGLVRLDYIRRDFDSLYETRLDMETGKVDVVAMGTNWGQQDLGLIQNSDYLTREYNGINLQATYRLERFDVGGNYTWSTTKGNYDGETAASGPVTSTTVPNYYPEYQDVAWSNPSGYLNTDQRHKVSLYGIWHIIQGQHNRLSASLLQTYRSGTPYGAIGSVRSYNYVTNPGYTTRPTTATYYFTGRDAYRTDNVTSTDLSVNYGFRFKAFGGELELFVQPEVQNVFDEQAVTAVNTTVYSRGGGQTNFADFNPWTSTPQECPQGSTTCSAAAGDNWQKGPDFGKPTAPGSFQTPRTFRISVGVRF